MSHLYPIADWMGKTRLFLTINLVILSLFFLSSCQKEENLSVKAECAHSMWKSEDGHRVKGFTLEEESFCFDVPSTQQTAFNYGIDAAVEEVLAMSNWPCTEGCKFLIRVHHPLIVQQPQDPYVENGMYYDPSGRQIQIVVRTDNEMLSFAFPEEFDSAYLVTNPGLISSLMLGQVYAGVVDGMKPFTVDIRGIYFSTPDNS